MKRLKADIKKAGMYTDAEASPPRHLALTGDRNTKVITITLGGSTEQLTLNKAEALSKNLKQIIVHTRDEFERHG